ADAKVAAPGPPAKGHADVHFGFDVEREELAAELLQPALQVLIDAVPNDVEKATRATCLANLCRDRALAGSAGDEVAHVDDRDVRELRGLRHGTESFCARPQLIGLQGPNDACAVIRVLLRKPEA